MVSSATENTFCSKRTYSTVREHILWSVAPSTPQARTGTTAGCVVVYMDTYAQTEMDARYSTRWGQDTEQHVTQSNAHTPGVAQRCLIEAVAGGAPWEFTPHLPTFAHKDKTKDTNRDMSAPKP